MLTGQQWADIGTLAFLVYLIATWDKRAAKNRAAREERQRRKAEREAWLQQEYDAKGRDRPFPYRR